MSATSPYRPPVMVPTEEATLKLISTVRALGFIDISGEDWFDKGKTPTYVKPFYRLYNGQHQYLTLTTYDGSFVEGWLQVYARPYDSRAKQRQTPLALGLPRTQDEVLSVVQQVYVAPSK